VHRAVPRVPPGLQQGRPGPQDVFDLLGGAGEGLRCVLQSADRRGRQVDGQGGRGERGGVVAPEGVPAREVQAHRAAGERVRGARAVDSGKN